MSRPQLPRSPPPSPALPFPHPHSPCCLHPAVPLLLSPCCCPLAAFTLPPQSAEIKPPPAAMMICGPPNAPHSPSPTALPPPGPPSPTCEAAAAGAARSPPPAPRAAGLGPVSAEEAAADAPPRGPVPQEEGDQRRGGVSRGAWVGGQGGRGGAGAAAAGPPGEAGPVRPGPEPAGEPLFLRPIVAAPDSASRWCCCWVVLTPQHGPCARLLGGPSRAAAPHTPVPHFPCLGASRNPKPATPSRSRAACRASGSKTRQPALDTSTRAGSCPPS